MASLVAAMAATEDRPAAARALAARFGACNAVPLVRDEELGVLLPALGFPQTLPSAPAWRDLAARALEHGVALGEVLDVEADKPVTAIAVADGSVIVFVGIDQIEGVEELNPFLRLLDAVYMPERKRQAMEGQLTVAANSAQEVRALAIQLDLARKQLEQRVQERTEELRASVRELEGFTYSASHDLRTPLRAIVGTSRILQEEFSPQLPREAQAYIERQIVNALSMGNLIDDLLKLSRLNRHELARTDVDFSALAKQIAKAQLAAAPDPKASIEIQPGLRVHADQQLLGLALQNLVENAIKFSPGGGLIEIGRNDGAFFVRDQGIGFDLKYAHKIFAPFERLVVPSDFPGTGIGLANVDRIIGRHAGKIWVDSELGKGTTFHFTLSSAEPAKG